MKTQHTPTPWMLQKLNHADNDPWYQIGWLENGHPVGPVCELSGGAVRSRLPIWHPIAKFKYLIAGEQEIRANGEIICEAVNSHAALTACVAELEEALQQIRLDISHPNEFTGVLEQLKNIDERARAALEGRAALERKT